jgi:hypothetical protein
MTKRNDKNEPGSGRDSLYDDALLCANWNPALELLAWAGARTADNASQSSLQRPAEEDPAAFLHRVYLLGA